jgi:hypothetical protein
LNQTFFSNWTREKHKSLRTLEKFLLSFLGLGNELMSCYDKATSLDDKEQGDNRCS